jgi:DNA topoisomerase VI subunit B
MSLDDLLKGLDETKITEIKSFVETELTAISRKKGEEVKKWMTTANGLRDVLKEHAIDPDGDIKDQLANIAKNSNATTQEFKALQLQVKDLLKEAENGKAYKQKLATKTMAERAAALVGESLLVKDEIIENWISKGKLKYLDDSDSVVWVDGESETTLQEGFESWKKANPGKVKSTQSAGSGGSPNKTEQKKTISRSDFDSLDPMEKSNVIKSGTKLED